jgi:hypothetical protein
MMSLKSPGGAVIQWFVSVTHSGRTESDRAGPIIVLIVSYPHE